ncbi:5-methylcytosine-specific restriction enzyme subunit McrC [Sphingobacterium zeae]|uniref:5-methylcytosine-specific restriction enzyme subunit McrC n=1 Tax=Sphingobacterium zeae TaxID=1776859 RepID=A0ABU0U8A6_9SPHI|nr:hypothetical protein [Sphingobacterium zeae]MDQ1151197.1 5-methylcytosine-specific restriction enzyme subunit McrC [Sphingobacterium zeae]
MKISLYEHVRHILYEQKYDSDGNTVGADELSRWSSCIPRVYKNRRGQDYNCYHIIKSKNKVELTADYYVGVDWLIPGEKYIHVAPKLNKYVIEQFSELSNKDSDVDERESDKADEAEELKAEESRIQVNYLRMLLDAMSDPIVAKECTDLIRIEWDDPMICIEQDDDSLTPFLVVQFLQLLRQIVRKGLKKSYYNVRENLNSRVKGKILVGQQVKHNILKNRLAKTYCEYQVFGDDNTENRFFKKVFQFSVAYIGNQSSLFQGNEKLLEGLINYIRPAFEHIGNLEGEDALRQFKYNPFFKEYKEALRIGGFILKRFAYNISQATEKRAVDTPPFWLDMPRLFELYVYQKLLQANGHDTDKIKYQYSTYGNSLDILIKDGENSMIIDAKYKLQYKTHLVHEDIRQIAGYARLNKVRRELGVDDDRNIDCLIIYPDFEEEQEIKIKINGILASSQRINAYKKVYKLGLDILT